jgi:hypothetical protein
MDRYILYACLTVTRIWLIVTLALFAIYSLAAAARGGPHLQRGQRRAWSLAIP